MKSKIIIFFLIAGTLLLSEHLGGRAFALESNENGEVFMQGGFINQDLYKLSIHAKNIKNSVIGFAFDLKFEQEKLKFLKYEPGNFLERGGDPIYLVKSDPSNSKIIFGESLTREDKFPKGEEKIADFYFQTQEGRDYREIENNISFEFIKGTVSTFDEVRQDLDKITWQNLEIKKESETTVTQQSPPAEDQVVLMDNQKVYKEDFLIGLVCILIVIFAYRLLKKPSEKIY